MERFSDVKDDSYFYSGHLKFLLYFIGKPFTIYFLNYGKTTKSPAGARSKWSHARS